jgi:hypothetical protein
MCVILVYTGLAYISFKIYPTFPDATLPLLVFKGILVGLLTLGNYLGGSLVLRDKIGLEK